MPHHYTKTTVTASIWCNKCYRMTEHHVYGGKRGPCSVCLTKLNEDHDRRVKEEAETPKQTGLFD
jgi:hypothetical protein